jgi:hypothetical protein
MNVPHHAEGHPGGAGAYPQVPVYQIPMTQQNMPYNQQNMPYSPMMMQQPQGAVTYYGPQVVGGMPQQYVLDPQQQQYLKPIQRLYGMDKLRALERVFIKQKIELLEVITGCETQNKYEIFAADSDGDKKGKALFKAKEKSGWCERNCLAADCRPFKMKIADEQFEQDNESEQVFLRLDRDCQCSFMCWNRPEVKVYSNVGGVDNKLLGSVVNPFMCCDKGVTIYDENRTLIYDIKGNCCQLGLWCACPCEPCQTVEFDLTDGKGNKAGHLQKRTSGCVKNIVTDADKFSLTFPKEATAEHKALLISAVLLIDYSYFEQTGKNNNQPGLGGVY